MRTSRQRLEDDVSRIERKVDVLVQLMLRTYRSPKDQAKVNNAFDMAMIGAKKLKQTPSMIKAATRAHQRQPTATRCVSSMLR